MQKSFAISFILSNLAFMEKKIKKKVVVDEYPKIIETFMPVGAFEMSRMAQSEPSAFNSMVRVEKYRVTIERIEEPIHVIQERLQKLWEECDNMHHWTPLKMMAAKYNYEFIGDVGKNRKRK